MRPTMTLCDQASRERPERRPTLRLLPLITGSRVVPCCCGGVVWMFRVPCNSGDQSKGTPSPSGTTLLTAAL
ncbi:hypothetical protein E2C01_069841 [Portunus trituberculatus]|uniref:Uncharacterized protein n=1 Tax=Portunus trituberculatus TaxID=210409 RepID=A0A5B7HZM7_PORTR|nr:hypothetical protein [Portunus trituberculatus]